MVGTCCIQYSYTRGPQEAATIMACGNGPSGAVKRNLYYITFLHYTRDHNSIRFTVKNCTTATISPHTIRLLKNSKLRNESRNNSFLYLNILTSTTNVIRTGLISVRTFLINIINLIHSESIFFSNLSLFGHNKGRSFGHRREKHFLAPSRAPCFFRCCELLLGVYI